MIAGRFVGTTSPIRQCQYNWVIWYNDEKNTVMKTQIPYINTSDYIILPNKEMLSLMWT